MIRLSVDGREIGDTVELSGPGAVEVEASAESIFPLHRLDIVVAGKVVASTESKDGARRLTIRERIAVSGHTWIAARCGGPEYFTAGNYNSGFPPSWSLKDHGGIIPDTHYDAWRRGIYAHTSPVYVACGGDWWMFDEATARHMLAVLDGSMRYIEAGSLQHRHGTVTHHHGEDDHIAYLKRPFLEAQELVEERLRRMR